MKLFHLSDLHLGRRLKDYSLIEDQRHILAQIISHIQAEKPDAVMIAGDVYDRALPSEEAVALFDDFLFELSKLNTRIMITAGNHDSQERLAYGGRILNKNGIHISLEFNIKNYESIIKPFTLDDEFGELNFYLLPFVTPAAVRAVKADAPINGTSDAVKSVLTDMQVDTSKRNILIAHQFVTGATVSSKSETSYVGGTDNVDASVFDAFDYVALGHIHGSQHMGRETVRYCGTPLKYSFSEVNHRKSITVVEVKEKGKIGISEIPLEPLRDLVEIRGSLDEVKKRSNNKDYIRIILDNKNEINVWNKLHEYFGFLTELDFADDPNNHVFSAANVEKVESMTRVDLFAEFFVNENGFELSESQRKIVKEMFELAEKEISGGNI